MITDLEKNNIKIVKDVFAAINRRDIPAITNLLDEKVDWQSPATRTMVKEIPWSKPRHGRSEVSAFFREILAMLKIDDLSYSTIVADGDTVQVEGTTRGSVIPTGCFYGSDWMMSFTLRNGKIVRLRHYFDSADIAAAFHSEGEECRAVLKAA